MRTRTLTGITLLLLAVLTSVAGCAGNAPRPELQPTRAEIEVAKKALQAQLDKAGVDQKAAEVRRAEAVKIATEEIKKSASPEKLVAIKAIEKNNKAVANNAKDMRYARSIAAIVCKTQFEANNVEIVDLSAFDDHGSTPRVYVRVYNPYSNPVSIEDERHLIVGNVCPGGSITIVRKLGGYENYNFTVNFRYTARGTFPDGTKGYQQSEQFYLAVADEMSGNKYKSANWTIKLQKPDR